jgi:hypothetical protein
MAALVDAPAELALKLAKLWHDAERMRMTGNPATGSFWSGRQSALDEAAIAAGIFPMYLSARDGTR